MSDLVTPKIGVVCYGNILRSQVLAAYLRAGMAAHTCRYAVIDAGVCSPLDFPDVQQRLREVEQRLLERGLAVRLKQTAWSDAVGEQLAQCALILTADARVRALLRSRLAVPHPPLYGFYELFGEGVRDFPDTYDYERHMQQPEAFENSFGELEYIATRLLRVLPGFLCQ